MDFSLLDKSKSSCEETEHEIIETAARSYGCIFCKRGFTTAQALGGHMNIHRKDRTTTKPNLSPSPSSSSSYNYVPPLMSDELTYVSLHSNYYPTYPQFYHPSNYYNSSAPDEPYIGLPISAKTSYYSFPSQVEQFPSSLQADEDRLNLGFSDDGLVWGKTLNLQGGPLLRVGDEYDHGVEEPHAVISEEDDEVDLELRLGYA